MEIEAAARRRYLSDPTIAGYVGTKVFKHRLEETVDGTGGLALVVWRDGGWGSPRQSSASEYPLLRVDCYADKSRADDGTYPQDDAPDKAYALYRAVNAISHGPSVRGVMWGAIGSDKGLLVVTSARWTEPYLRTQADEHPGIETRTKLGDMALVRAAYALHVAH